ELKVKDILAQKREKNFISVQKTETVRNVFHLMKENDISQLPVMDNGTIVGSITESAVLGYLLENPLNNTEKQVETIMGEPFPVVNADMPSSQLSKYIGRKIPAVIVQDTAGSYHIL